MKGIIKLIPLKRFEDNINDLKSIVIQYENNFYPILSYQWNQIMTNNLINKEVNFDFEYEHTWNIRSNCKHCGAKSIHIDQIFCHICGLEFHDIKTNCSAKISLFELKQNFTKEEVQEIIYKAEQRIVNCILSDIDLNYSLESIKNKIKNKNYIGNDLITFLNEVDYE